jgi:hypothetical protein
MAGLDPAISRTDRPLARVAADCRVEPGNDGGETNMVTLKPF